MYGLGRHFSIRADLLARMEDGHEYLYFLNRVPPLPPCFSGSLTMLPEPEFKPQLSLLFSLHHETCAYVPHR